MPVKWDNVALVHYEAYKYANDKASKIQTYVISILWCGVVQRCASILVDRVQLSPLCYQELHYYISTCRGSDVKRSPASLKNNRVDTAQNSWISPIHHSFRGTEVLLESKMSESSCLKTHELSYFHYHISHITKVVLWDSHHLVCWLRHRDPTEMIQCLCGQPSRPSEVQFFDPEGEQKNNIELKQFVSQLSVTYISVSMKHQTPGLRLYENVLLQCIK